jgi:hypothetical protein
MNVRLAFGPLSQAPVDLLIVVLDDAKVLHETDDATIAAHLEKAAAGFREKTLKREYFATLPEGAPAQALVVYWSPSLKSWNLWENVKTFTARGLRLARDYRMARVGVLVNARDAAPLVGKVTEGAKPTWFDFAEQLRLAEPPPLSFRPSEAGFGEIHLALVITPRVYFYNLRYARGVITFTARNTLDNTADLFFRVEADGKPAVEKADNLGPNLERDYSFEVGPLKRGDRVWVTMEKAQEALESAYRFADIFRMEK